MQYSASLKNCSKISVVKFLLPLQCKNKTRKDIRIRYSSSLNVFQIDDKIRNFFALGFDCSKTVFLQIKQIYFSFDWLLGAAKYFAAKKLNSFRLSCEFAAKSKIKTVHALIPSSAISPQICCEIRLVEISL